MGKKTKKTRWRTLSIGDGCSDTEASVNETSRNNQKYGRTNGTWYNANNQKYSNQSTPIKQYQTNGGHYNNHNHRGQWSNGHYARSSSHQETSKSTTRSSSTVSEHKIKFNEDEYTRITTPRQDVLFKKGYLSKPKPYLQQQRSLTSTGNSTGDGTPDHQSADGNDVVDSDYDQTPFMFPAANSGAFIDGAGMFFVNGFEPYAVPPHHVLVYDQYGNAVVCLPPPQLQQPPLTTTTTGTTATIFERRSKRYSTDSMTESTSPHNESNQDAASTFNDTDEAFLVNEDIPSASTTTQNEDIVAPGTGDTEQIVTSRIRKKRRRKKIERNKITGDGDGDGEMSSDELSSLSGDEIEGEQQNETNKCDRDEATSTNSCKYRVDAEEFIPRCYQQPQPQPHMEFVPLPVGMPFATFVPTMFPLTNHQIYFNNPHHFPTTSTTTTTPATVETVEAIETTPETITTSVEPSEETTNCDNQAEETTITTGAVDIAKIVSKLEQAAKEQQQVIDTTICTTTTTNSTISTATISTTMSTATMNTATMSTTTMSTTDEESVDSKSNQTELNKETNKTEPVPLTTQPQQQQQQQQQQQLIKHQATNTVENVRYSERLKQSQNHVPQIKPTSQPQQVLQQQQQQPQQTKIINKQRRTTNQTCPRLERSASSKPKTITNTNSTSNNNNIKTIIPPTTTTTTTTVVSNNQWIAVSGKKKRGKNKQLLPEPEEPQQQIEQIKQVEEIIKPNEVKIQEMPIIEIKDVEVKAQRVTTPATSKNNPTKKPATIKKRILINDDLIVANNVIVAPKASEEKTVVPVVEQPEINKQQSNSNSNNKTKKKPNKKTKNKSAPKSSECNNNIDKSINETVTPIANNELDPESDDLEANKRDDSDDVSLELDRMIQRGLYGNLEQRLRSFNPADSFLKQTQNSDIPNVNAATAAASVIGTMAAAVLKKPSTYFGQTSGINGFIPPKVIVTQTTNNTNTNTTIDLDENVARSARNDSESSVASSSFLQEHQRFPITRAVREWMNKTRENTPEVEIFKKPNEIREEFNLIIQPQDEPINEVIEEIEVHQVVDEMSSLGSAGALDDDLLDCWEPEINYEQQQQPVRRRSKSQSIEQQQQQPAVEQAEDVLETYESVYGRSEDFARIQREVLQQQQQQQQRTTTLLNNNPRVSGVDGALPYRAICCSIM